MYPLVSWDRHFLNSTFHTILIQQLISLETVSVPSGVLARNSDADHGVQDAIDLDRTTFYQSDASANQSPVWLSASLLYEWQERKTI